jgi:transposase
MELLQRLQGGVSVRCVSEEYGVGSTTIYDFKKQKDKLLNFYSDGVGQKLMKL